MIERILIASDAWHPQVNGVVRTLDTTVRHLAAGGQVRLIEPGQFASFPCPCYPEIRLAWPTPRILRRLVDDFAPQAIHISTEGPIGLAVRALCRSRDWRFTTAYHTQFVEYAWRLAGIPRCLTSRFLRWFHRHAAGVQVASPSLELELRQLGFTAPITRWSRGVDLELFHPRPPLAPGGNGVPGPLLLYVGRVSKEKGLDDFLSLPLPGRKVVVGDGPARRRLERRYPQTLFRGELHGEALAQAYAEADVFVFPSRTDTFGLVILEALASGVPVAAYPVPGPRDILIDPLAGALDDDLGRAVQTALARGQPEACVRLARQYSWQACTQQFRDNLVALRD